MHGAQPCDFTTPTRVCAGATAFRCGPCAAFVDHLAGAVIPSLLVLATLDIGQTTLHVAGMSFLGLGVTAPTAEWA